MKILTIQETKERLLDFAYSRGEYIRHVSDYEYQTRCPYCGDSQKDFNTGHFYFRVNVDDNYVIPSHCFKCNFNGIVNAETLELMGNTDIELTNGINHLNRRGRYIKGTELNNQYLYFERELPEEHRYPHKIQYIENRLGVTFTREELKKMKVVTSLYDFLILNNIKKSPFTKEQRMVLEKDYVGFLSSGNSHILFRDVTETHKNSWVKYPIDEESRKNKVYYGMSSEVDVFTRETITINLSEGVIDTLGIYYHLNYQDDNTFNLAVAGQLFNTIIRRMVSLGVFGSNVILNVFSDNDEVYNDNPNPSSTYEKHKSYLMKFKPLFKEVNLYYNLKQKDYGIKKEEIILKKIRI